MAKTPKLSDKTLSPLDGLARRNEPEAVTAPTPIGADESKVDKKETHTQISAYIPNQLYKSVRRSLVGKKTAEGAKLTLTDLLINLLSEWEREQE